MTSVVWEQLLGKWGKENKLIYSYNDSKNMEAKIIEIYKHTKKIINIYTNTPRHRDKETKKGAKKTVKKHLLCSG